MTDTRSTPASEPAKPDLFAIYTECFYAAFPGCRDAGEPAMLQVMALQEFARRIIEECAKVCDVISNAKSPEPDYMKWDDHTAAELARRIRATNNVTERLTTRSENAAIAPPTRLDVLRDVEKRIHDCYKLQRASAWPHCAGLARAEVIVRAMIEEAKK